MFTCIIEKERCFKKNLFSSIVGTKLRSKSLLYTLISIVKNLRILHHDALGVIIYKFSMHSSVETFDVSNLPSGLYYLRLLSPQFMYASSFEIIR